MQQPLNFMCECYYKFFNCIHENKLYFSLYLVGRQDNHKIKDKKLISEKNSNNSV